MGIFLGNPLLTYFCWGKQWGIADKGRPARVFNTMYPTTSNYTHFLDLLGHSFEDVL